MKSYTITVNGTAYECNCRRERTVQCTGSSTKAAAPAAPKAAPAAAPKAAAPAAGRRFCKSNSRCSREKYLKIEASVGQAVKAGDSIVILEVHEDGDSGSSSAGRNSCKH